jgi:uncharacterized protein (DUF433 family)
MATIVRTHVRVDEHGVAWIEGTTTRVIQVALDKIAQGWSAEEIHAQYPYLSLAQIHAALSYYYDHQEELDAEIEREYEEVRQLRAEATGQRMRPELEARRRHPTDRARIAELVREQLARQDLDGITIEVQPDRVRRQDEYWYVPVLPSRQPPKMYAYYEVLAEVEATIEENEELQVFLVPVIPTEAEPEAPVKQGTS